MGRWTILALRVVLAAALAGSLVVQVVLVPLAYRDLDGADADVLEVRTPVLTILVLGILAAQVVMVCVWRLATMARRGTVFSSAAFRWVDVVIGAIAAACLLLLALGVVLAPGEAVAPGLVLLIGGAALVVAGIALVVLVMRALLAQAVDRDAEASQLRAELDEVI
ncbi:DUF2975 domain-containing protein [Nocardioides pantholopis]|uniref:DUF2975 domain-containing protein n=1 Tax=Nocardioides pantholopis TaxID=2483798 RepID=UPI000F098016|nr:DUF2975 domain-containing protein [Nocardioides pantholopis]